MKQFTEKQILEAQRVINATGGEMESGHDKRVALRRHFAIDFEDAYQLQLEAERQRYTLSDLDADETVGRFVTMGQARQAARKLRAYEIWRIAPDGERAGRVEHCDPYAGEDSRALQGLGQAKGERRS